MHERPNAPAAARCWSERQRQVLDLVAAGCTNAEIGERLGITFATAKWHVSELITELGVESREEVAAYWLAERRGRRPLHRLGRAVLAAASWKVAAAIGACGLAAIVGLAVAALLNRTGTIAASVAASATPPAITATSPAGSPGPASVAAGQSTPLPRSACEPPDPADPRLPMPIDLSFIDGQRGWVLAETSAAAVRPAESPPQCAWIGTTTDGGKTWAGLPFSGIAAYNGTAAASHIVFTDAQTGWLWGPGLYVTRDGGTTWSLQHDAVGPAHRAIVSFSAAGQSGWAIEGLAGDDLTNCPCALQYTQDAGAHWTTLGSAPVANALAAQVVATGADDAWLAVSEPPDATPSPLDPVVQLAIFVTHDSGEHWTQSSAPQAVPAPWGQLVVSGAETLWWTQWGTGGMGMSSKWVYRSEDGGAHWQIVADDVLPSGGKLQNLPANGDNPQLTVVTPSLLFLAMGRATPYVSRDGGDTWAPAIPAQTTEADAMGFVGPVVFGDATHGVVADFGEGLFVTSDSGHTWTQVQLPRG